MKTQFLEEAGLIQTDMLYMRPEAKNLWKTIDKTTSIYLVQGPPGTGKSCVVWGWACEFGLKNKLLWINVNKLHVYTFVEINHANLSSTQLPYNLAQISLNSILMKEDYNCIIFDGISEDNSGILSNAVVNAAGRIVIFVSSQALTLPGQDIQSWKVYTMTSWTKQQYTEACQDAVFFESIKSNLVNDSSDNLTKEELINSKFTLAGFCARWFFGMNVKNATSDIDNQIKKVGNAKVSLLNLMGSKSPFSVNHLLAQFEDCDCIVSAYVTRRLTLACEFSIIDAFLSHDIVRKNPAFLGWVVELNFLMYLRLASHHKYGYIMVCAEDHYPESWPINEIGDFEPTAMSKVPSTDWLTPKKWNQGGYDFVNLQANIGLVRVIQVTHGKSHDLKLEFVVKLITALNELKFSVNLLDVVLLYPEGNKKPSGKATGDLNLQVYKDFKTQSKWSKNNIRYMTFNNKDFKK